MFYPKNVPQIERILRIVLGIVLVAIVLIVPNLSPLVIGLLLFSAVFVIVTGFIGWCPACAMLGRKLSSSKKS